MEPIEKQIKSVLDSIRDEMHQQWIGHSEVHAASSTYTSKIGEKNNFLAELLILKQQIDPLPREPRLGVILVVRGYGMMCLKVLQPVARESFLGVLTLRKLERAWDACKDLRSHEFALLVGERAWAELEREAEKRDGDEQFLRSAIIDGVPVVML